MWTRIVLIGGAALSILAGAYLAGEFFGRHASTQALGGADGAKRSEIRIDFNQKPISAAAISPGTVESTDGQIETLAAHPMLFIDGRVNVTKDSARAAVQASYKKIRAFMSAHHLTAAGPPIAVNEDFDTANQVWIYRAGIPLKAAPQQPLALSEGISLGKSYGGLAVRFVHIGDPNEAQSTYAKIDNWMGAKNFTASGPSWEEYVSDPQAPVSEWRTNIYVPLG